MHGSKANTNSRKRKAKYEKLKGMLCMSQVAADVYDKLTKNGRQKRLLSLIRMCSSKALSEEETAKTIVKYFNSFITEKELGYETFLALVETYPDIYEAWMYGEIGDELNAQMIKDRAFEMAMQSDDVSKIVQYTKTYVDQEDEEQSNSMSADISFNIEVRTGDNNE
ncbi:hypothetical protein [Proteiniborus sp. MB09-C3]|uniref:hypothetical protein n=1 Tax=Proteiniborus sp. MB09-C3 TaxID=3050072 RepID=UPI0025535D1A|nr:hypothetical protein [Proteiniborus sp. MB09-C3]WIV13195.1 hypothetical protein QO263_05660 [Proteiniborus sp. MB09-C3]